MSEITYDKLVEGNSYTLVGEYKTYKLFGLETYKEIYQDGTVLGTYIESWSPPHFSGDELYFKFKSVDNLNGSEKIIDLEDSYLNKCKNKFILV